MEEMKSRVFILTDEQNRVIRIEGEYTLPQDLKDWILIEEGEPCDRLNLAQTHYLEKGLMTDDGIYQYKYIDDTVTERTQAEIDADRQDIPIVPTDAERLEAQVMYTAVCTDTLLED